MGFLDLFRPRQKKQDPAVYYNEGMDAYRAKDYDRALPLLERAAGMGYAQAQYTCGMMYYFGNGTEVQYDKALPWYAKAAQQGHLDAQFSLAFMYSNGLGTRVDKALALQWYENAAEQGHVKSQFNCGAIYASGEGTAADRAKAREWFERAAEQGHEQAKAVLASWRRQEPEAGTEEGEEPAAQQALPLNSPIPDTSPQEVCERGLNLFRAKHYDQAYSLLSEVCPLEGEEEDVNPQGHVALGWIHENRRFSDGDKHTALRHYSIAAKEGNQEGMKGVVRLSATLDDLQAEDYCSALIYLRRQDEEIRELLGSRLEQKWKEAQEPRKAEREELYQEGLTAFQLDMFDRALPLLEHSSQLGHVHAQYITGRMYQDGMGTPADMSRAMEYFEAAARQGLAPALFECGLGYLLGRGVARNPDLGFTFMEQASDQGFEEAQQLLDRLKGMEDQAEAQDPEQEPEPDPQPEPEPEPDPQPEPEPVEEPVPEPENGKDPLEEAMDAYAAGDFTRALTLFEKEAAKGSQDAQLYCGLMYTHGQGTGADAEKGLEWLQEAAGKGNPEAQVYCGIAYYNGRGTEQNLEIARMWLETAADQGSEKAKSLLEEYF